MAALGRLVVGRARSRIRGSNPDLATRYDKLAVRYEATIHVTAMNEWLHALRDTT